MVTGKTAWEDLRFPGPWAPVVALFAGIATSWVVLAVAVRGLGVGPAAQFLGVLAFPLTAALVSVWLISAENGLTWVQVARAGAELRRGDWPLIGLYLVVVLPVAVTVAALAGLLGLEPGPEVVTTLSRPEIMLLSFTVVPVGEELWGRGLVFGVLRRWGPVAAVVGTGLLTAAWHLDPAQVLGTLPGMLALSWLRHVTGRLAPGVLAHALNNLLASAALLVLGTLAGSGG